MTTHPYMSWEEEDHYWSRMRNNPGLTPIVLPALLVEDDNEDPFAHLDPTIRCTDYQVSAPKTNFLKNARHNRDSFSYTKWVKDIAWDVIQVLVYGEPASARMSHVLRLFPRGPSQYTLYEEG